MKIIRSAFIISFFIAGISANGQMSEYTYMHLLSGVNETWHSLELPCEVFKYTQNTISDVRIYGITKTHDTIEAPYILERKTEDIKQSTVNFNLLNTSHNSNGYYFTFEIPSVKAINRIELDFKQKNFDWKVQLEGSQNQQEWFTIKDNYRIVSIDNELTKFNFSQLVFPKSKYQYYRLCVKSKNKPRLKSAEIFMHETTAGKYNKYPITHTLLSENKPLHKTEINVTLKEPVPISYVKVYVGNTFDYYRPIQIEFLSDSVKTEQGWKYYYQSLARGILNSIEQNEFWVNTTTAQKLRITVSNFDNEALSIDSLEIKGYVHELAIRFTNEADYYLCYGNSKASKPVYDIVRFKANIPDSLPVLKIEKQQQLLKQQADTPQALFINKIWLWLIMGLIIVVLGWFSLKMIKNT